KVRDDVVVAPVRARGRREGARGEVLAPDALNGVLRQHRRQSCGGVEQRGHDEASHIIWRPALQLQDIQQLLAGIRVAVVGEDGIELSRGGQTRRPLMMRWRANANPILRGMPQALYGTALAACV